MASGRLLAATFLLSACSSLGPRSIVGGRSDYNDALQQTNTEQLLLNIVRLRYREPTFFLDVSNVTSRIGFEAGATGGATLQNGLATPFDIEGAVKLTEEPSVTYLPLQGEEFARQLLSPVGTDKILLLSGSGWSVERILRLCAQELNDLPNAPTASGPTPDRAPTYAGFRRATHLMRQLQRRGALGMTFGPWEDGQTSYVLEIAADERGAPETAELQELLGLDPAREQYEVHMAGGGPPGRALSIELRSLMAILFFVSQGVEVPEDDSEHGRVTVTRTPEGEPFDWEHVLGDLIRIRCSRSRPADAAVAVRHRGTWFYVDDRDLESKTTLLLLVQLFALQAGSVPGSAPLLTIPVG